MALKQTPFSAKNSSWIKTPLKTTGVSFFSPNPKPQHLLFSPPTSVKFCIKSSTVNNNGSYEPLEAPQYPKPPEIQWKKELCNSVQLIGILSDPVEIKHLTSGKVVAWTRIAVKKSSTDTSWINLTFWDELALVAFQHLEKGHQVYVSGRFISDTVESDDGKQQIFYKVVVQQLNFIQKNSASSAFKDGESIAATPGKTLKRNAAKTIGSVEELWQTFFANPLDWWDNRKNKRNPNYPDFKHKDTGEALWVEGRYNPTWVKSQLADFDKKSESFSEQDSTTTTNPVA